MRSDYELERRGAIERYLAGESPSAICASLGHARKWFYTWLTRYDADDPHWCGNRPRRPASSPARTPPAIEAAVLATRRSLEAEGLFFGAQAIRWELEEQELEPAPSLRTIGRILVRHGLTRRRRGPYEPKGKRYPGPRADRPGAVHQSDFIGPRYLKGPLRFYSLNSVDVATGRGAAQPVVQRGGQQTVNAFWATWWRLGMPAHQQVDNELVFYGSPVHPRGMGSLIRLCLHHGIEAWFIPPGEPWWNGVVEKFNDHWEAKFLRRCPLGSVEELARESLRFEERHNGRYRYSKLGGRTPQQALVASRATLRFPPHPEAPQHPLPKPEHGRYHLVRFVRSNGLVDVFSEKFKVPPEAVYEYVRLTVDVECQRLLISVDGRVIDDHPYALR